MSQPNGGLGGDNGGTDVPTSNSPNSNSNNAYALEAFANRYSNVVTVIASVVFGIAGLVAAYLTMVITNKQAVMLEYQSQPVFDISFNPDANKNTHQVEDVTINYSNNRPRSLSVIAVALYTTRIFAASNYGNRYVNFINTVEFGISENPHEVLVLGADEKDLGRRVAMSMTYLGDSVRIKVSSNNQLTGFIQEMRTHNYAKDLRVVNLQVVPRICTIIRYIDVFDKHRTEFLCKDDLRTTSGKEAKKIIDEILVKTNKVWISEGQQAEDAAKTKFRSEIVRMTTDFEKGIESLKSN